MSENKIIIRFLSTGVLVSASQSARGSTNGGWSSFFLFEDGGLPARLTDKIKEFRPGDKTRTMVILARRFVIYKYFSFPSKNPQELRRMVELQLGRQLPFAPQEIVYQLVPCGIDQEGLTRVVVAITREKMVRECLELLGRLGIKPAQCFSSAFAVASWHARRFPDAIESWVLVADTDEDEFELCFCQGKRLMFARTLSWPDNKATGEGSIREIEKTFEAFSMVYPGVELSKVVITGVDQRKVLLNEVLSRVSRVPCQVDEEKELKDSDRHGSLYPSQGLMHTTMPEPDLMPRSPLEVSDPAKEWAAIVRMFIALVFFTGALFYLQVRDLNAQKQTLKSLQQEIQMQEKDSEEAAFHIELYEYFKKQDQSRVIIADLFRDLYRILPESVALTNVQLSKGSLAVLGQTRESADVGALQKGMMSSAYFQDVTLQYANRPQRLAMEYTEFKIVCSVRNAVGGEP